MIDKTKVSKCVDAMNELIDLNAGLRPDLTIKDGRWTLWVFGPSEGIPDDKRQKAIAILTPLVGKMQAVGLDWEGSTEEISIYFPHVQLCKVVVYKKIVRKVKKEIEREPEYEEVEEEVQVPISDCDIKAGRFSESDIEVPA